MLAARLAPWKRRLFRFGLGAATVGVTAVFGVVRSQWLARHLDAVGLGMV